MIKKFNTFNENIKTWAEDEYKDLSKKVWDRGNDEYSLDNLSDYSIRRASEEGQVTVRNDDGYALQRKYKFPLGKGKSCLSYNGEFFDIIQDPSTSREYDGSDYYGDWIITKVDKSELISRVQSDIDILQGVITKINNTND